MCSREIIDMFLIGQVFGLVENFNVGIFLEAIHVMNVKLCVMVLHNALAVHYACSGLDIISRSQHCQIVLTESFMFLSD